MDEFSLYGSCGASAMPRNERGVGSMYGSFHYAEPTRAAKYAPMEDYNCKPSDKAVRRSQRAKSPSRTYRGGASVASAHSQEEPALLSQLLASGEDPSGGLSDGAGEFDEDDSHGSDDSTRQKRRRGSTHVPVNYRGVTFVGATSTPWKATINHKGTPHELGFFATEEAAARKYDEMARQLHGEKARLNFPKDGERSRMGKSLYRGISWQAKCSKFEARLKFNGKMRYIGVFTDEVEAAKAWDMEALRMRGRRVKRLNFPDCEDEYIAKLQASGEWSQAAVSAKPKEKRVDGRRRRRPAALRDTDSSYSSDEETVKRSPAKRPRRNEVPPKPDSPAPATALFAEPAERDAFKSALESFPPSVNAVTVAENAAPRGQDAPFTSEAMESTIPAEANWVDLGDSLRQQLLDIMQRYQVQNANAPAALPMFFDSDMSTGLRIDTNTADVPQSTFAAAESIFTMTHGGKDIMSPPSSTLRPKGSVSVHATADPAFFGASTSSAAGSPAGKNIVVPAESAELARPEVVTTEKLLVAQSMIQHTSPQHLFVESKVIVNVARDIGTGDGQEIFVMLTGHSSTSERSAAAGSCQSATKTSASEDAVETACFLASMHGNLLASQPILSIHS